MMKWSGLISARLIDTQKRANTLIFLMVMIIAR